MFKRHKIKLAFLLLFILLAIFLVPGVFDYYKYRNAIVEAQGSGFPWQCGAYSVTKVQPGCTLTTSGCTCSLCVSNCTGSTEMDFMGQENCGAIFACISPEVMVKGGATTIMECSGKQAILAGTSNLMMNGNAVVGCPGSMAAGRIDQFVNWFDKFIIAGFKNK